MYILTIDTGTTNTRVTLWKDQQPISKASREVGVRDTAVDGNNQRLKDGIKQAIEEAVSQYGITLDDVSSILASGMITSNVGLYEVPHLQAPAGFEELAAGMVKVRVSDFIDRDIWFVPGVKNNVKEVTLENCEEMDIMRGEEVEVVGLMDRLDIQGPAVFILPGSHTKFVSIDERNKMTGCLTSLAGEMISMITHHSIIANAVDKSFVKEFKQELVIKGFEYSQKVGMNRTCFTIRVLDQFSDLSKDDLANFLLGVVLADDLKALKHSHALHVSAESKVFVAGKDALSDAFEAILEEDGYFRSVQAVNTDTLKDLAGHGVIRLAQMRNDI
ncbi:2-dehydro-3-deoxygalactonokinase [Ammoniphilus sp. 3BR4]|uniref:2-dehydro-3-deoxygalactonokinase n=1 Tax=Ammoniphilus sp. 3BR4 TaxID=3158265 RepID=UPI00346550FD